MREFKGTVGAWRRIRFQGEIYISSRVDKKNKSFIPIARIEQRLNGIKDANLISCAPDMVKFIAELMEEQGDKLKEQESWIYYRAKKILDKALGDE